MPNKPKTKLNPLDVMIRELSPNKGVGDGPQVRITLIRGFELFNTRAYHNHETWSDGYRVELLDDVTGLAILTVEAEDLDEVLQLAYEKWMEEENFI